MQENEVKKKKNHSLIMAIVIVIAIIGISYLGICLYANYLVKYYKGETDKLVSLAQSYVEVNKDYYGENIFNKLDKNKKVTDGLVYVNGDLEVALAIIYDDTVCYVKYYNSDGYIDNIKPDYCKTFLTIHLINYDKNNDSNEEDDVMDDTNNSENNNNTDNDINNDNTDDKEINTVINHLAFDIKFNEGDKASDLKLAIKVNGHATTDYSYDYLRIYKVDNNDYNTCDIDMTHTKLSNNYVLKSDEKYVVKFEELKVKNMEFADGFAQVSDSFFVNDVGMVDLEKWCVGSKYESGNSMSFIFELPTLAN